MFFEIYTKQNPVNGILPVIKIWQNILKLPEKKV